MATLLPCTLALALSACLASPGPQADLPGFSTAEISDGTTAFTLVTNPGTGPTLSVGAEGFELIELVVDGVRMAFKDMDGDGELDPWEDWRLDPQERAADLVPQLSSEQLAGLMLFSLHERSPGDGLTDAQRAYLDRSRLRNVLHAGSSDVESSVPWTNQMQAFAETLATDAEPYIPVNVSSDPRSDAVNNYTGHGGTISTWPAALGLAATFSPDTVRQFGRIASAEYRALGITHALSPQADLASEPRWLRNSGTFGEDPQMTAQLVAAYVEGFQGTYSPDGQALGWGAGSVATTVKHFPGDGRGEGGRDSHTESGQYAIMSTADDGDQLAPFQGALDSAAIMTAYSILTDVQGGPAYGEDLVGSGFNTRVLELLREDLGYTGIAVADWGVITGGSTDPDALFGMPWGMEDVPVPDRILRALRTGHDTLGGFNQLDPVLTAHQMWQVAYQDGEVAVDADTRFQISAQRTITMLMRLGLYESPFQDVQLASEVVGNADFVAAGWRAQLDSIVVAKNQAEAISCDSGIDAASLTVYIPQTHRQIAQGVVTAEPTSYGPSLDLDVAQQYFGTVVTDEVLLDSNAVVSGYQAPDLSDVDLVVVGMDGPDNGDFFASPGLDLDDGQYYPLSLQYRPYLAEGESVRQVSIAGDRRADGSQEDRSYAGNAARISNEADLEALERAVAQVRLTGRQIPVVVALSANGPVIPREFEPLADAIVVGFGVSDAALLELITGSQDSTGRLPMTFPSSMATVEANREDVPFDLDPYRDSQGNPWEYGYGLSTCSGTQIE
ncbi:MAG: glycoside hydrolase family 3 N-terminal domain-containing protein [Beutenbergiaceae bacterium]